MSKPPRHDEIEQYRDAPPGEAPPEPGFNVAIQVPETIEIRMVEASALADYEIWFFATSCSFTLAVAFGVAYVQEEAVRSSKILLIVTAIFAVVFVACLIMTLLRRARMTRKFRNIYLKTGAAARVSSRQ